MISRRTFVLFSIGFVAGFYHAISSSDDDSEVTMAGASTLTCTTRSVRFARVSGLLSLGHSATHASDWELTSFTAIGPIWVAIPGLQATFSTHKEV